MFIIIIEIIELNNNNNNNKIIILLTDFDCFLSWMFKINNELIVFLFNSIIIII